MNVEIIEKKDFFNKTIIIFKLESINKKNVFMRVEKINYCNDKRYVVIVNTLKIYSSFIGKSIDDIYIYSDNYGYSKKYNCAEKCFLDSLDYPIPLTEVAANIIDNKFQLRFIDGLTRLEWLINNKFHFCPIETDNHSVKLISEHFNICQNKIFSVQELLDSQFVHYV